MSRVFICHPLPAAAMDLLRPFELTVEETTEPLPSGLIAERAAAAEGILSFLTETIDEAVMEACPYLKVISNCAVGYNNIDLGAATARRILVTNTPGVLTETTADLAWALLLATARRLVEADAFVRAGRFRHWELMLLTGTDVHGKTLGVVGFGRIGQAVARRAVGFNMRVLYYDPQAEVSEINGWPVRQVDLPQLLAESDFISLHTPYLPETHHLIGQAQLEMMKPTGILINTARGPVVDEAALVRALEDGRLAGAGLDVFEDEPKVHPGLLGMKQVVLAPHIGSASVETRTKMAVMAARNLAAALRGEPVPHPVNAEILRNR
ncbi:MAG: D-glycerate dehydrogenase [Bacillota bacterium]